MQIKLPKTTRTDVSALAKWRVCRVRARLICSDRLCAVIQALSARFKDHEGRLYVLFRSAQATIYRDMYLLESNDHGATFHGSGISKWNVGYRVMSSEAFVSGPAGTYAAWETGKQVHLGLINSQAATATDVPVSSDLSNQKYPSLAMNRQGLILASWTEGMGWKRGGSAHWQLFDPSGRSIGKPGFADGVPTWSLVAAYTRKDGTLVVLF